MRPSRSRAGRASLFAILALATLVAPSTWAAGITIGVFDAQTGAALMPGEEGFRAVSGGTLRFVAGGASGPLAWSFGDGAASAEAQPTHAYATSFDATFVVSLATGAGNASATILVAGPLGPPLTGDFTMTYDDGSALVATSVEPGRAVRFTANDAADRYDWTFGDGTSGSGSPAAHVFAPGSVSVSLTVTRAGTSRTTATPVRLVVLPEPARPVWLVPGIAWVDGLGGALWRSDLTLMNPDPARPMSLSLAFLDGRTPTSPPPRWYPVSLAPLESRTLSNVLAGPPFSLARGAFGAIAVRGDDVPSAPVVNARTYSGSAGTYGLSSVARASADGTEPQAGLLIGLVETPTHYTNLGVANLDADPASVDVRFLDAFGRSIGTPVRIEVPAFGVRQLTHIVSATPPMGAGVTVPLEAFTASVTVLGGTAVAPYATVIDARSKDPVFVAPAANAGAVRRLPGVVRANGVNGTVWRSDVVIQNPSANARDLNVTWSYRRESDGKRICVTKAVRLESGASYAARDFVKGWLGLADGDSGSYGEAYLDVAPADADSAPILVAGRTYNDQPEGETGLGTPGFTAEDAASATGASRRLVLAGLRSDAAFRTNLAVMLLPGAVSGASVEVTIVDDGGRTLATRHVDLDTVRSLVQLGDGELFAGAPESGATAIVRPLSGAAVAAYATVIDQLSGDASFVAGQPAR